MQHAQLLRVGISCAKGKLFCVEFYFWKTEDQLGVQAERGR